MWTRRSLRARLHKWISPGHDCCCPWARREHKVARKLCGQRPMKSHPCVSCSFSAAVSSNVFLSLLLDSLQQKPFQTRNGLSVWTRKLLWEIMLLFQLFTFRLYPHCKLFSFLKSFIPYLHKTGHQGCPSIWKHIAWNYYKNKHIHYHEHSYTHMHTHIHTN